MEFILSLVPAWLLWPILAVVVAAVAFFFVYKKSKNIPAGYMEKDYLYLMRKVNEASTITELSFYDLAIDDFTETFASDSEDFTMMVRNLLDAYRTRRKSLLNEKRGLAPMVIFAALVILSIASCTTEQKYIGGGCPGNKDMVGYNRK